MRLLESLKDLPDYPDFPKEHVVVYQGDPITSASMMDRNFYVTLADDRD
jgi:hypothetical protein